MDDADTQERFAKAIEEAVDWAVQGGMTITDMQRELRHWIETMDDYPEEFQPL